MATPKTVVSVRGSIGGFAQDGNRIVWLWPGARRCRDFVLLRNLRTHTQVSVAAKRGATCPPAEGFLGSLALAGDRALWAVYSATGGNTVINYSVSVVSGRPRARDRVVSRFYEEIEKDDSGDAAEPTVDMAGDGSTLVFAFDGVVRRLVRARPVRVAPYLATAFATTGGKIAVGRQTFPGGCLCNESPHWSPDGSKLIFSSGHENSARPGIYTMAASGGPLSRLADGVEPLWSPDGSKIVLAQSAPGAALIVVDSNGGNLHRIDNALDPAWSPDGTRLAFTRPRRTGEDVVVVNADGSAGHVLAANARLPDWSPDGTKLAVVGRSGIDVIGADGSNRHTIVARFAKPSWSPTGSRLLFSSGDGLHVISADGSNDVQVTQPDTDRGENDYAASWSPSGSEIAFVRSRFDPAADLEQERRIRIANADGSGERPLTSRSQFEDEPAWSPTGGQIAFTSGRELYVTNTDGTGLTRMTTTRPAEARSAGTVFSASKRKLASFGVDGNIHAIAFSRQVLAVLVRGLFGTRIELFDPATGAARGGVDVDAATAGELSAAGRRIVFHHGPQVMELDAATMKISVVAVAARAPIGLSIEGRRIAWAENLGARARIRALTAP
jgi:TolB protein